MKESAVVLSTRVLVGLNLFLPIDEAGFLFLFPITPDIWIGIDDLGRWLEVLAK